MKALTAKKVIPVGVAILLFAAAAFIPVFSPPYTTVLLSSIVMYVVLSSSWTMFSGATGYISLATAAFFGIGMYTSAFLGELLYLPALMLLGGALSFVIAVLVGAITLRLRGVYFTIFTYGLVELLKNLVLWLEIRFTHTRGRFVAAFGYNTVFYCLLALLALVVLASVIIKRSRLGKALEGIAEQEDAAAHIGINTTFVKVLVFAISAFAAGAAGAAMATRWSYIDPGTAFNSLMSFTPVLMAIFGGMHRVYGPVIGAVIFAYLQETLITRFPNYYMITLGVVMVAAIIFLPNGLIGLIKGRGKGGAVS